MKKIIVSTLVLGLVLSAAPALAAWSPVDLDVSNKSTVVTNVVTASANTGANSSMGGNGGAAGNGGKAEATNGSTAEGGNGGDAGKGGKGGSIWTGDATAQALVDNDINSTDIKVSRKSKKTGGEVTTEVKSKDTLLANVLGALADTGYNNTDGGNGAKAGKGGSASADNGSTSEGGNGGKSGNGAMGGEIHSGISVSAAGLANLVNRTKIKIKR